MSKTTITAKLGREEDAASISSEYDFGDTMEDAIELFGDEVVFNRFKAAVTVDIQAMQRRLAGGDESKTESEIQTILDEWKPGVQRTRKSPQDKAKSALENLSEEERAQLLAQFTQS